MAELVLSKNDRQTHCGSEAERTNKLFAKISFLIKVDGFFLREGEKIGERLELLLLYFLERSQHVQLGGGLRISQSEMLDVTREREFWVPCNPNRTNLGV